MSIGWDAWRDVGMAQQALTTDARHQEHLKVALTPEDGAEVFERALHMQLPHLMVNTTPLAESYSFYEPVPDSRPAPSAPPYPATPRPNSPRSCSTSSAWTPSTRRRRCTTWAPTRSRCWNSSTR